MAPPLPIVALDQAVSQLGVREVGRNRGTQVEEYLASVGLGADPGPGRGAGHPAQ